MENTYLKAAESNANQVLKKYLPGEMYTRAALVQSQLAIAHEMRTANLLEFAKQIEDPTQKAVIFEIINERLGNLI